MRYKLRHIWIAAALALGACSQEATDGETGGAVAMELTASGLQSLGSPMTRSTVDGDWEGFDLPVAVKMGDVVKKYKVTEISSDKKKAKLSSTDPLYWPVSGKAKVMAWYPAGDKPSIMVEKDQSGDGYAKSDCLLADEQEVTLTKNGSSNLEFTHRTAKIRVALTDADKTASVKGATVALDMDGTPVVTKCYNPENTGDYLALVVPTNDGETAVLTVRITVNGDDQEYVYTHSESYAFEANHQYVFKLKLDGYKAVLLEGCTIAKWKEDDKPLVEDGLATEDKGYTLSDNGKTYHVTSANGLKAWAKAVENSTDKNIGCVLEADITMPGETWTPVGTSDKPYVGTFDGNGKTIKNLRVGTETTNYAGFFGCIGDGGKVKNLTLDIIVVDGKDNVGAVAGKNSGTISHCYVTNSSVSGSDGNVGGIAGWLRDGTIEFCGVSGGKMYAESMNVGGIAGVINNGTVVGCYAVSSLEYNVTNVAGIGGNVAGIGGNVDGSTLTACYADCTISGDEYVGGICGFADYTSFSKCYWKAEGATAGVGDGSTSDEVKKADSWTEDIMSEMNTALDDMNTELGDNAEYKFINNPDYPAKSSVPYIHVKNK